MKWLSGVSSFVGGGRQSCPCSCWRKMHIVWKHSSSKVCWTPGAPNNAAPRSVRRTRQEGAHTPFCTWHRITAGNVSVSQKYYVCFKHWWCIAPQSTATCIACCSPSAQVRCVSRLVVLSWAGRADAANEAKSAGYVKILRRLSLNQKRIIMVLEIAVRQPLSGKEHRGVGPPLMGH